MVYKDKLNNLYVEIAGKVYTRKGYDWYTLPEMIEVSWTVNQKLTRIYRIAEFNLDVIDLKNAVLQ